MKNRGLILFKNKYRTSSIRLKNWDYSSPGFYFITICTKNMQNMFGKIINEKIILNKYGYIVKHYLKQIHAHFRFVCVDSFIVMPNHIHLILQIKHTHTRRNVELLRFYGNENAQMSKIFTKAKINFINHSFI
ncbi:MAG TPA: hypothetical protein PLD95_03220 [bacterium]|jgi:REP element-mobilizing transposase RayT|nr:hypothetical protein [bacterium]HOG38457.1 hypothetical protein [bacterium]